MMKSEVLRALLVDRELGELSPDAKELLDAYLEAVPSTRAELDTATRTLSVASEAVRRFPELTRTSERDAERKITPIVPWLVPWLAWAAVLVAVAGLSAWIGYHAATSGGTNRTEAHARVAEHRFEGLWSRYQVAYDTRRATYVLEKQQ